VTAPPRLLLLLLMMMLLMTRRFSRAAVRSTSEGRRGAAVATLLNPPHVHQPRPSKIDLTPIRCATRRPLLMHNIRPGVNGTLTKRNPRDVVHGHLISNAWYCCCHLQRAELQMRLETKAMIYFQSLQHRQNLLPINHYHNRKTSLALHVVQKITINDTCGR